MQEPRWLDDRSRVRSRVAESGGCRRVCFFQNIIAPYRLPLFAELDRLLAGGLVVVYAARTERRRAWDVPAALPFAHVLLPPGGSRRTTHLSRVIQEGRFDAVISAGSIFMPEAHAIAHEGRRAGARVGFFWESHLTSGHRHVLKTLYHRLVLKRFDVVFVPGWASWDQCVAASYPPERIVRVPNSVDVDGWEALAEDSRRRRDRIRAELELRRSVAVYVGRFSPEKDVARLVRAFRASPDPDRSLLLVGSGPEERTLRRLAAGDPRVVITGFRQGQALADAYVSADVHVLPSLSDPWGLVVNEAMACGLPSIVSDRVGAREMVVNGYTGLVVTGGDELELRQALDLLSEPEACAAMGVHARELCRSSYSPKHQAALLAEGLGIRLDGTARRRDSAPGELTLPGPVTT